MSLYTQRNSLPLWCFTWKKYELVEDWYEYYRDDFDDGVFGDEWTTHGLGANRTIEEDAIAETVTIEIANNTHARWWCLGANLAPKMYMPLSVEGPCRITTKLLEYVINDDTMAGLFIATDPEHLGAAGTDLAFLWGRWEGANFARVQSNCGSGDVMAIAGGGPFFPTWLQIRIDADNKITFWLNPNGAGWQQYTDTVHGWTEISGYDIANSYVGLFAKNIVEVAPTNIAAPFEYFLIEVWEARSPTEEECYAPIDTRSKASSVFYDGYVKSMSNVKRAIDDKTGLFQITDMSLTLTNARKYFSSKLTNRILKNQEVVMYHAWTDEPEANKSHFVTLIVEDHSIKGPDFLVKLKDISQKYFTKKIPEDICTSDDYPHINPDHEGRPKPEILGLADIPTGYEHEGAVEAVYVDTTTGRYVAANRPLHDILDVFVDDTPRSEGGGALDYAWGIADGDTYIDFVTPPGTDEVVSFNAEGYMRAAWDSVNGYIQNPAYIILFYLRFIMGIPASLLDIPAFWALASYYEDVNEEESCYLILQYREDAMELLRQLLFTAGAKGWINMDGEFTAERKDIDDWEIASTDYHIFEQTDLIGSPHRKWNLTSAINTVNAQYGYIPWQRLYTGARSEYRDNRYELPMEDDIKRILEV